MWKIFQKCGFQINSAAIRNNAGSFENIRLLSESSANRAGGQFDIVVVGGGIVGTATARELLLRHWNLRLAVVEKENCLAAHQSGHNSGVIHAGIYYKPGTLKAKLCVQGLRLAYKYLDEKKIPYKKCGKLIVATNPVEVKQLAELHDRGIKNEVPDLQLLTGIEEIQQVEPYCHGLQALWSPQTGIVDWGLVTEYYAKDIRRCGGEIFTNFEVIEFKESEHSTHPVTIVAKNGQRVTTRYVLTCGGLHADVLSELSGGSRDPRIVPFRGEYLLLNPDKAGMIRGNIYPVPDPRFPFLGVHFTPRMDGSVWLGPNAVMAFKREGYTWSDINMKEFMDALKYPGFQRLALKYVGYGAKETLKSMFINLQVKSLQKFIPEVTSADITRGPAGVRAQAVDRKGNLVDDFIFDSGSGPLSKRILHCRNAPSPGATSSQAIAKMVADKLCQQFEL